MVIYREEGEGLYSMILLGLELGNRRDLHYISPYFLLVNDYYDLLAYVYALFIYYLQVQCDETRQSTQVMSDEV